VTAPVGCTWTAASNAAWLTTASSSSGNGSATYSVAANSGAQRSGTITIGAQSFTLTQQELVTLPSYPLSVSMAGAGSGSVGSIPQGIVCGADCSENYAEGTIVTLSAAAAGGSIFSGWSGACTGTALCQVTMSAARSVTASFDLFPCFEDADHDGMPNCVEITEGRNPYGKDNDIFASAWLFSRQQYRDFLGREGELGGLTFWTGQINGAASTRAQVVENFFSSAEFQGTVAPVARLYFAYFLRIPDYAGLRFWIDYYKAGHTLDEISNLFAASGELQSTYGSLDNGAYVTLLYDNVLGRAPDSAGHAFWVNQLDTSQRTRGQVMLAFSESEEYRAASFNMVYVTMMYAGMLRRAPDQGGFDFWVSYLNAGNAGLALIDGFLAAPEYRARFLP
jgi:hypothetical protein